MIVRTVRAMRWIIAGLLVLAWDGGQGPSAAERTGREGVPAIDLVKVVDRGLHHPLFLTHAGDGTGRLFVVEQTGRIRIVERGVLLDEPFLDITDRVLSEAFEQGLLGLAFHPRYRENGRFFVNYTRKKDGETVTVLAEFQRAGRDRADPKTERILMAVPQPHANHNGGMVAFGPEGLLYVGRGDGGSRGDPQNRAQNKQELLGKILRLDVDRAQPYAIPADNPFSRGGGRPEIYAYGVRNPWRFSFDRETNVLWLADVGQNKWEEIDLVTNGDNFGWRVMEGVHCFEPAEGCQTQGMIMPIYEYGHEKGRCSVTGGYVYRGNAVPTLRGTYVFGDFCTGELFGIRAGDRVIISSEPDVLRASRLAISSFGEDETGELYVIDHGGAVYRITAPGAKLLP